MVFFYDLIVGALFGIIIFIILYKLRSKDFIEPFNFLKTFFESSFSGMTLYVGFASIWHSFFGALPFGLTTIANENMISFFGGISIISITLIMIFRKEILFKGELFFFKDEEKELSEISVNRINFCYAHHKFKNEFNDIELSVIKVFKDNTLQINTKSSQKDISKKILFDLMIKTTEYVEGKKEEIPSKPVAICKLLHASDISTFKIVKWFKINEYNDKIKDLKQNNKIRTLKPFLKLRNDYIAEKYNFEDLKKVKEGIDNLISYKDGD